VKRSRIRRPSAAMGVAMLALFVALSGIATAAVAVPLAKRALVADNAKKLGGKTPGQLSASALTAARAAAQTAAAQPGPASTVSGLAVVKTSAAGALAVDEGKDFSIACDAGQKVIGGGFSSNGGVFNLDSFPQSDTTWVIFLVNGGTEPANVTLYASCLK
jgi:hypothetical protein